MDVEYQLFLLYVITFVSFICKFVYVDQQVYCLLHLQSQKHLVHFCQLLIYCQQRHNLMLLMKHLLVWIQHLLVRLTVQLRITIHLLTGENCFHFGSDTVMSICCAVFYHVIRHVFVEKNELVFRKQ